MSPDHEHSFKWDGDKCEEATSRISLINPIYPRMKVWSLQCQPGESFNSLLPSTDLATVMSAVFLSRENEGGQPSTLD